MPDPAVISAKALGAMPQFVLEQMGPKTLERALRSSGLPVSFTDCRDGYIPEVALANFVDIASRECGDRYIGLLWAPELTVADYGAWGAYVLSAPTLGAALERARRVMPYHASEDRTFFRRQGSSVGYEYRFALKSHSAYPSIALLALGSVLSIFKYYLGSAWQPSWICCDLPRPKSYENVATTFGCPVLWDCDRLEIWFDYFDLKAQAQLQPPTATDLPGIQKERGTGAPTSFIEAVRAVLQIQLETDGINLETAAIAFDMGPRSLQRHLRSEGKRFRDLSNEVITKRAIELLQDRAMPIQDVATELGYSSSQNFSRAFRKNTGITPSDLIRGQV